MSANRQERTQPRPLRSQRGRRRLGAALLALAGAPQLAHAGPNEVLRDVVFDPGDARRFAAVYAEAGGGLLVTDDGGETFRLLCSAAVHGETDVSGNVPMVAWTEDGHLLFASSQGLFRGDARGCGFQAVADLPQRRIAELYADPLDHSHYALTSAGGELNGVYRSWDHGATWDVLGTPEEAFFRAIRVAALPGGQRRVYLSVCKPDAESVTCELRISEDELASVRSEPFEGALDLRVVGVDARDPDRVYAAASIAAREGVVLFVSDAAGASASWRELGELQQLGSFVTPGEGGFVAVDVTTGRLVRGRPDGDALEELEVVPQASCYALSPDEAARFACNSFQLQPVDPAGTPGAALLDFNDVAAFVDCPGEEDVGARCAVAMEYGWCGASHFPRAPICAGEPGADAGGPDAELPDAGTPADGGAAATKPDSTCSLTPAALRPAPAWLLLLGIAAAGLRRRRR